jgi:hypothetical protein
VWVVSDDTARGNAVRAEARRYPAAMVPAGAISTAPSQAVATHSLPKGAIVTALDLAQPHRLPPDWVVFAVPRETGPDLHPADDVAVFADGRRVCDGTVVEATGPVELAVAPRCAAGLSTAVSAGEVVLARLGS